jgi:hypothetical protein
MTHPTYTFQVDLQNPGLFPSRYQTDQDLSYDQNNAMSDTRSIGIPGVGFFKHGEKFTVSGVLATQILNLMNAGDIPVVTCSADEDANCVPDTNVGTDSVATATGTTIMFPVGVPSTVARGSGYNASSGSLDLVGGTYTSVASINIVNFSSVAGQDETIFTGGELTGTFTGGSGYAVSDTITMSDGTVIVVDAVSTGAVTEFTISSASTSGFSNWATLTQSFSSGEPAGIGFTLTMDDANQGIFLANYMQTSEIIDGEYTVLPTDPVATTAGTTGSGATFNVDWGVREVTVTDGGLGYSSAPAVSFGGDGSSTFATALLTDDVVTSVTVTASGSGYTSQATVTFDAP